MQVLNLQEINEVSGGCAQPGGNVCLPVGGLLNAAGAAVNAAVGVAVAVETFKVNTAVSLVQSLLGCKPKC